LLSLTYGIKRISDPLRAAIDNVKKVSVLAGENKTLSGKFRARARDLPSLVTEIGLVPALSFCYGKAGKDTYEKMEESFSKNIKIDGNEEESYALYLLLVLDYIRKLGLINQTEGATDVVDALNQLSGGERLSESALPKVELASKLIRPYLLEIKRLSEALFEPVSSESGE